MKKLLLLPIIFVLVSCQPSELERCVVANTQPTPINDYLTKINKWDEIKYSKDANFDYYFALDEFINSLNPLEEIVHQCILDKEQIGYKGMTQSEATELYNQNKETCMTLTINEVIELQQKIVVENKENAISVCHSQGIY